MIIVSDTSPISNLLKIHRLGLLHAMYGDLIIPPAVNNEIEALISKRKEVEPISNEKWIKVVKPAVIIRPAEIKPALHKGELEAISLAKELKADWLLMDEKAGRKFAQQNGIKTIGLIGVLLEAKKLGHIEKVLPLIDDLIQGGGFWLRESLYNEIKLIANE